MEVRLTVEVEKLKIGAESKTALMGYFTMVAIDEHGHTVPVPELILETPEEMSEFEEGRQRYLEYKKNHSRPNQA